MKTILAAIIMTGSMVAQADSYKRMEFYEGDVKQKVEVEYDSEDLKKRSYESKCRASLGVRITEKSIEMVNGHYNCQDGYYSDPSLRLAIKEGKIYFLNRYGKIGDDAKSVGDITADGFNLTLSQTRKVETHERKIDEKGCPTHEMVRVENELSDSIAYTFTKSEKGYSLNRVRKADDLVHISKRYEKCQIKFAREIVESKRVRTTTGVLNIR